MPAIRSPENAALICLRITEGRTLRQIAKEIGCVNSAIVKWTLEDEAFGQQYLFAKRVQADLFAEETIEIADDSSGDWVEREVEGGGTIRVVDHEAIQRSRLRVDTRKWYAAKMAPKRYGERVEIAGDRDNPLEVAHTIEDRRERARAIIDAAFAQIAIAKEDGAE